VIIGFGMGATEMEVQVQFYSQVTQGKEMVDEFRVVAEGSKKPGLATPIGIGAATGMMAGAVVMGGITAATEILGPLSGNAKDTAEQIAQRVAETFVAEGWLPKEALE
jgi:hypothetical protein